MKKSKMALITLFFTLALSALHSPSARAQVAVPTEVQVPTPAEIRAQTIIDLVNCLLPEEYLKAKRALQVKYNRMTRDTRPASILELKKLDARSCAVVAQFAISIGMTKEEIQAAIYSRYKIRPKNLSDSHEGGSHTGFVEEENPVQP